METPVYLCGTHAVGTVHQAAMLASGRGPDDVVLPVVGECDDGDMADSRTVVAGDVDAALEALGARGRRGQRRRRHRDDLLRLPRRHRHGLAARRRPPRGRAAAVQLRRPRVPGRARACARAGARPAPPRTAPASRSARPTRRCRRMQLRRLALRPLLGPRARRLLRGRGLGRDRPRVLDLGRAASLRTTRARPVLRRRLRGGPRGGLQLPRGGAAGASGCDGTMQDAFPLGRPSSSELDRADRAA